MLGEEVEMSTYSSSVESNGQAGPKGRSGLKRSMGLWIERDALPEASS